MGAVFLKLLPPKAPDPNSPELSYNVPLPVTKLYASEPGGAILPLVLSLNSTD